VVQKRENGNGADPINPIKYMAYTDGGEYKI
jgi:hypothetical protein